MNLTFHQFVLLSTIPTYGSYVSRPQAAAEAMSALCEPSFGVGAATVIIDELEAFGLVERVRGWFVRRTYEGNQALSTNLKSFRRLIDNIDHRLR